MAKYPDDSFFSLPIWRKGTRDYATTKVQLNPATALAQSIVRARTVQLVAGVSVTAIFVVMIVGSIVSFRQQQTVNVQASVDVKHALAGTVTAIESKNNTFTVLFDSSIDPRLQNTKVKTWTVELPPGQWFGASFTPGHFACFSVENVSGSLSGVKPGNCGQLIHIGKKVLVEYLKFTSKQAFILAKTIIIEGQ